MEEKRLQTNPNYILREIAGESILVPVGQGGAFENSMITLNETSAFLWKLFSTPRTLQEAIDAAKEEYDDGADGQEIETHITQYAAESLALGMLQEK